MEKSSLYALPINNSDLYATITNYELNSSVLQCSEGIRIGPSVIYREVRGAATCLNAEDSAAGVILLT